MMGDVVGSHGLVWVRMVSWRFLMLGGQIIYLCSTSVSNSTSRDKL